MRIVMTLTENPTDHLPYWDMRIAEGDNIVYQVVSKTFNVMNDKAFEEEFKSCTETLIRDIGAGKLQDQKMLKHMLINESVKH